MTISQISQLTGKSPVTVFHKIVEIGLKNIDMPKKKYYFDADTSSVIIEALRIDKRFRRAKPFTQKELLKIEKVIETNGSIDQLAKKLNCNIMTLYGHKRRYKIEKTKK